MSLPPHRRAQVEVKAVELLRHREQLEGSGKSQAVRLDELARKEAEVAQREGEVKVGWLLTSCSLVVDWISRLLSWLHPAWLMHHVMMIPQCARDAASPQVTDRMRFEGVYYCCSLGSVKGSSSGALQ